MEKNLKKNTHTHITLLNSTCTHSSNTNYGQGTILNLYVWRSHRHVWRSLWTHPSCTTFWWCVLCSGNQHSCSQNQSNQNTRIASDSLFFSPLCPLSHLYFYFPNLSSLSTRFKLYSPLWDFCYDLLTILLVTNLSSHGEIFLKCKLGHGTSL